jgi:hypothetical protein
MKSVSIIFNSAHRWDIIDFKTGAVLVGNFLWADEAEGYAENIMGWTISGPAITYGNLMQPPFCHDLQDTHHHQALLDKRTVKPAARPPAQR